MPASVEETDAQAGVLLIYQALREACYDTWLSLFEGIDDPMRLDLCHRDFGEGCATQSNFKV